jgi:hypothetical protein
VTSEKDDVLTHYDVLRTARGVLMHVLRLCFSELFGKGGRVVACLALPLHQLWWQIQTSPVATGKSQTAKPRPMAVSDRSSCNGPWAVYRAPICHSKAR